MSHLELSDEQLTRFASRVLPHMDVIQRSEMSESQKLRAIGHIVSGTLDDLRSTYREGRFVTPSVLPSHDNVTIDRLAQWQRVLNTDDCMSDAERALALEKLEHGELIMQASERPQVSVAATDEEDPPELLPWFAQGGE